MFLSVVAGAYAEVAGAVVVEVGLSRIADRAALLNQVILEVC